MAKKRKKQNYGAMSDVFVFLIIAAIVIGVIMFLMKSGQPDIGTDFPAEVNDEGDCVSREGIEMGMCCAVIEDGHQKWVLCESLVEKPTTQAFFTFEEGARLEGLAGAAFVVKLTNSVDSNADANVRIKDVTVSGPDPMGVQEIQNAVNSLESNTFSLIKVGESKEFSMNVCTDLIRIDYSKAIIDVTCGYITIQPFQMENGLYSMTINLEGIDELGVTSPAGSRTVTFDIKQEVSVMNIEVEKICDPTIEVCDD